MRVRLIGMRFLPSPGLGEGLGGESVSACALAMDAVVFLIDAAVFHGYHGVMHQSRGEQP